MTATTPVRIRLTNLHGDLDLNENIVGGITRTQLAAVLLLGVALGARGAQNRSRSQLTSAVNGLRRQNWYNYNMYGAMNARSNWSSAAAGMFRS